MVPCSNAAYIKTIEVLLKGARQNGCQTAVLVTGGRSHRAARAIYPEFPEIAFVRIGDFIQQACACAADCGFENLVVCCMPGKLAKYALGHEYTHAHRVRLSLEAVSGLLVQGGMLAELLPDWTQARSVREFLGQMSSVHSGRAVQILADQARCVLQGWSGNMHVQLRVLAQDSSGWLI